MPIDTHMRIVNRAGSTLVTVDDAGMKDATSRIFYAPEFTTERLTATPLAAYAWTVWEGIWQVAAVTAIYSVVGGSGAAVDVLVCPGVTAPGSGTTQLTGTISLTATAPAKVNGTLIASPTSIFPGDSVARVISGTPGSLEGMLTIWFKRIG